MAESVVVGVEEVVVLTSDAVPVKLTEANVPSQVMSESLSREGPCVQESKVELQPRRGTSVGSSVAGARRQRAGRSRVKRRVPMLTPEVQSLLESQVGKFTHALCMPLREPVYVDPTSTNQETPHVKSVPCEQDHVVSRHPSRAVV